MVRLLRRRYAKKAKEYCKGEAWQNYSAKSMTGVAMFLIPGLPDASQLKTWEHCNEVDNVSKTILLRGVLEAAARIAA